MSQQLAIPAWIEQIERGFRPCIGCGQFHIKPTDPEWKTRCPNCFIAFKETAGQGDSINVQKDGTSVPFRKSLRGNAKHCRRCGDDIKVDRLNYALRVSGGKNEALNCQRCKNGITKPCEKCNQIHPAWWTDHPSHP